MMTRKSLPPWKLISATRIGSSHLKTGTLCQDAHLIRQSATKRRRDQLIIAISDGAGTAARSDEGANRAVQAAVKSVDADLSGLDPADLNESACRQILVQAFQAAQDDILQFASVSAVSPREFAATLALVFTCGKWFAAGQVGDGLVVVESTGGSLSLILKPQHGEYANETNFIITADMQRDVDLLIGEEPVAAVVAMTDGMLRLALDLKTNTPFEPFFRPLIALAKSDQSAESGSIQLADFLSSERVMTRTDDDKTLVVAVRQAA